MSLINPQTTSRFKIKIFKQFPPVTKSSIISRRMKILYLLGVCCLLLPLSSQIITLQQLSSIASNALPPTATLVQVTENSFSASLPSINRQYYIIKVLHRDKTKAYTHLKQLYNHALRLLIKLKIIPDEQRLIKSKIKPQFLNKKRSWSFSLAFVLYGTPKQIQTCSQALFKLGIVRLETQPTINFLNQKMIALEVFNSAKARLSKQLERFQGFQIQEVQQIQIKCAAVENSDLLQQVLEEEFNHSEQIVAEQREEVNHAINQPVEMRVLFKVGTIGQQSSYSEDWSTEYSSSLQPDQSSDDSQQNL